MAINGLHHNAYRCRDSEETRAFCEDFLGLPLHHALRLDNTRTGREVRALHTFFQMADGSFLAFFEVPGSPFDFSPRHDFDLHIALGVDGDTFDSIAAKARVERRELRGPVDHGFIRSIYLRDPNGYVVELTVPIEGAKAPQPQAAHAVLDAWQSAKNAH
jgi:catechol 2,3-dioxygenase-like lactoylglutathione lyase family enzyme